MTILDAWLTAMAMSAIGAFIGLVICLMERAEQKRAILNHQKSLDALLISSNRDDKVRQ